MFTGIVEGQGRIVGIEPMAGGFGVRIATPLAGELSAGDSLAVAGVCLTVILAAAGEVHAEIGPETARVTTLGGLRRDQPVNLERAMRTDGRLGGHFVLGHVDGVGSVQDLRGDGESHWLTVAFPPALAPFFIHKGSVAVDGVSLTVASLGDARFDVQVIPYTWVHTTLHALRTGDKLNVECDMVGKYVVRSLELRKQS